MLINPNLLHFQGSRMEDQRCSLPQILTLGPQGSPQKDKSESGSGPPRSASFSPSSDIERQKSKDKASQKQVFAQGTVFIFKPQEMNYI